MKHVLWVILIIVGLQACSKKVPLNRDEFTSLLIDIHSADGTLETWQGKNMREKDKYFYYNDLFKKHNITKVEFDSCVAYYSGQSALFSKIYDAVIDTLSRRQTEKMRQWKQLTINDSINLFPGYTMTIGDTLRVDSIRTRDSKDDTPVYRTRVIKSDTVYFDKKNQYIIVRLDSIVPGMYRFKTTLKLDKKEEGKRNYIRSYFLSDASDTLKVQDVYIRQDTVARDYNWMYYVADSIYNQLVIKIVDTEKDPKVKVKVKVKKKEIRAGSVWNTEINKTYVSPRNAERLKMQYAPREKR